MNTSQTKAVTGNLTIHTNPLIEQDLTIMMQQDADIRDYNGAVTRITFLLASLASGLLDTKQLEFTTKWGETQSQVIDSQPLIIYIERGVKAMRYPFELLYPNADTLTLTASRDGDNPWNAKLTMMNIKFPPHNPKRKYIIADATCATGGTIFAVADYLRKEGLISPDNNEVDNLAVVSIFTGQPGLDRLFETFPKIHVYTARVIPELDKHCYLIHGPYDAGTRGNFCIETIKTIPESKK